LILFSMLTVPDRLYEWFKGREELITAKWKWSMPSIQGSRGNEAPKG
jgi:hypothetical protein